MVNYSALLTHGLRRSFLEDGASCFDDVLNNEIVLLSTATILANNTGTVIQADWNSHGGNRVVHREMDFIRSTLDVQQLRRKPRFLSRR